ncbi:integral membrane protein MviN [Streptomyces sp. NBRC 110611]|uniref:FtsX-like permease family protein n=1 Tax=Streptomyces sp. NBRC 110611 TaxID=1621259 RepID=UPI00082EC897|nr:FtsX-like permease family protein [Streptomyces sp. NBRC 110611]GAU65203.1 integral membrane protein MviN [Streptomyces sp. NBRC 110611]
MRPAIWIRDLAMGMRFAAGGGREGWVRTALTALGVGLGVALLLGAASIPTMQDQRNERSIARMITSPADSGDAAGSGDSEGELKPSATTVAVQRTGTDFRGTGIEGMLLRPDGSRPPLPPGVAKIPGPGEMVVSPALKELLQAPDSGLLRERLPYRIVGTIGDAGLMGPNEQLYYAGSDRVTPEDGALRITGFGGEPESARVDPVLLVLVIVGCVVLLMPVAIFIATAVRFGGERRDRRLAALRLIGADARTTRRIAAGEALLGSVLGLAVGAVLFLAGRPLAELVEYHGASVFPTDLTPIPALAALIALAVPAAAVGVTLLALRGVTIEPLGVVRSAATRRRRLWWRLPVPAIGVALLVAYGTVDNETRDVNAYQISSGAALVLLGVVMLLPWLVEAVVGRLKGGPVPWQLAVRRLQLSSGSAARAVSGITVAVAGAIALQMLFSSASADYVKATGQDSSRAQLMVMQPTRDGGAAQRMIDEFHATKGVRGVIASVRSSVTRPGPPDKGAEYPPSAMLSVGSCTTLRELTKADSCKDGEVFLVKGADPAPDGPDSDAFLRPGARVDLDAGRPDGTSGKRPRQWTVPTALRTVEARPDPHGGTLSGLFATPSAVDVAQLQYPTAEAMVQLDRSVPDAAEYARNTAARIDPGANVYTINDTSTDKRFASVSRGLMIASLATMALIAASLLVTTLEQLRERRRLLSVLVAFGTRRATLGWSVLWQTALPVGLGLALAVAGGLGLAYVLLRMVGRTGMDWSVVWPLVGTGAGLVLVVTLLSLPPLWRMMRPDGLRTE